MATAAMYRILAGPEPDPLVVKALTAWSDERLAALLAARPDLAVPQPSDFDDLAVRAASAAGVDAARRRLDQWCLEVADAVCLLGRPATIEGLRAVLALPVDQADLDAALARLEDLALIVRTGSSLHPVEGLREVCFPAGLGPPAEDLLDRCTVAEVREMLRRLGLAGSGTKAAMLEHVVRALGDPRIVHGIIDTGPKGTAELVEALGRHGEVTVAGGTGWLPDHTPAGWLVHRGLAGAASYTTIMMTREGGLALRGGRPYAELHPRPPALVTFPADQAVTDAAAASVALRLVSDLAWALDRFGEAPPRILKSGGIGIRDVRAIAKGLDRTEAFAARLIELAGVAGLAAADPATGTALPLPAYDDWLGLDTARRWTALVGAWLDAGVHVSVAGAADTKGKPIPPLLDRGADLGAAAQRRLLLTALADAGEGVGVDQANLRQRVIWAGPAQWAGTDIPPAGLMLWVAAEAEMLGLTAADALSTAGRHAAGADLAAAADAFGAYTPDLVDHIVLQADLSAMAPGELAPLLRAELELLADVESTGAATVYRFSETSLRRGFTAGRTADEIAAFLEAHASRGVPQPLAYLVADLGRRHGQVRVGRAGCYVRCDDPSLLAEVCMGRRTAALGLRELAPTVAVTDADPAAVLDAMVAGGYLAAEEDGTGALVLSRPARRRASGTGDWRRHTGEDDLASLALSLADPGALIDWAATHIGGMPAPEPPDPASVVAHLRAVADGTHRPAPPSGRAGWAPELFVLGDDVRRPTEIARQAATITALLDLACEQEWPVRLAYAGRTGRESQETAYVLAVEDGMAYIEITPTWRDAIVPVPGVRWARVLTEAEEEAL